MAPVCPSLAVAKRGVVPIVTTAKKEATARIDAVVARSVTVVGLAAIPVIDAKPIFL